MKQVKCRSGVIGWQCKLKKNYTCFEEFRLYAETFNLHNRLGYKTPEKAWKANPTIQGSTIPSDLRKVKTKKK